VSQVGDTFRANLTGLLTKKLSIAELAIPPFDEARRHIDLLRSHPSDLACVLLAIVRPKYRPLP
jgi:hypothetical protein